MGKKKKISKAEQKKINKKRFQRLAETIKGKDKKFGKKVGKKKKWADAPKEEPVRKLYYGEEYATGTFVGNLKGFGFVTMEDREEDIFIPESQTHGAMDQDQVQIIIFPDKSGKRQEGTVVKILEHGMKEVIGSYQRSNSFGFVLSDNPRFSKDVFIPKEYSMGASTGDKVVAQITDYGNQNRNPEGKITEILGKESEPGTDILAIAKSHGLPTEFPEKVKKQAERVKEELIEGDFQGRLDLRDWTVVTIDGEDAKDLDDGISLTKEGDVYHLGVHIADVSNYVQANSAMDREALKRGTSVYLVDRVIPMLPKRLSNGICSLNQGEDRLALSCLMDIDSKGKVIHHQIAETVICVNERMTYTNVKKIIERTDEDVLARYQELVPMFDLMAELSAQLRKRRKRRGSIDFDFPECKVILNSQGKPVDIRPYEQNVATRLIEDFMLLANETVAQEFYKKKIPFVYRTHEEPDPEKIEGLLTFLRNQGFEVQKVKEKISPKEIQKILRNMEGQPEEPLISRMTLRTMQQAKYTTDCSGHFGLAAKYYCHFTSPIRRYPDLQIHRIIKDELRGRMNEERKKQYAGFLDEVAQQSSAMERRAEEAERETEKLKKAEYMLSHIGESFTGVISGVTGWGLYVELPNTVEGLVHISTIRDDYYNFDEESRQLVGEMTGHRYMMGQKVTVRVMEVDTYLKSIDFVLTKDKGEEK